MTERRRAGVHSVDEAADILRMGRSTLYRLIREGKVSYRLLDNAVRLTDADIDEYLEAKHRPAAA